MLIHCYRISLYVWCRWTQENDDETFTEQWLAPAQSRDKVNNKIKQIIILTNINFIIIISFVILGLVLWFSKFILCVYYVFSIIILYILYLLFGRRSYFALLTCILVIVVTRCTDVALCNLFTSQLFWSIRHLLVHVSYFTWRNKVNFWCFT